MAILIGNGLPLSITETTSWKSSVDTGFACTVYPSSVNTWLSRCGLLQLPRQGDPHFTVKSATGASGQGFPVCRVCRVAISAWVVGRPANALRLCATAAQHQKRASWQSIFTGKFWWRVIIDYLWCCCGRCQSMYTLFYCGQEYRQGHMVGMLGPYSPATGFIIRGSVLKHFRSGLDCLLLLSSDFMCGIRILHSSRYIYFLHFGPEQYAKCRESH